MAERAKISVIMPAYNEEKHIEACFNKVTETLREYGQPFEIILEEDGSTDKTPEIMDKLAGKHPYVKTLHFPKRMGKGFGIRRCFEAAQGKYLVLIDSDLEYPPEKIRDFLDKMNGHDIVVGHRRIWKNQKKGNVKAVRAYLSRIHRMLVKKLFGINLQDYQSGLKVFKRKVIEAIQPLTSNGFEIDSEILIKAQRRDFKIGFIPITYTYKGNSKVNVLSDPPKMFLSMLRWKVNGQLENEYGRMQNKGPKFAGEKKNRE